MFKIVLLAIWCFTRLVSCDMTCHGRVDSRDSHKVDLSYMFTAKELHLLKSHRNHDQFLPGLEALVRPYISLISTKNLENKKVDRAVFPKMKIESNSGNYLRASYGTMTFGRAYSSDFKVSGDPFVKLSASLIVSNISLQFVEYNATISTGEYIGYNLVIGVDMEDLYDIELEPKDTYVKVRLHQTIVGAGPIIFTDHTDCETVERRKDLNLGRICGNQVFVEMSKWTGAGIGVIEFLKPAIFKAVHCSIKDIIHDVVEAAASYAVMLAK